MVVETAGPYGAASTELREAVRAAIAEAAAAHNCDPVQVVAVWAVKSLPVDIRHNAKIDRAEVARDMERILAGSL
jgi:hypothetical protein